MSNRLIAGGSTAVVLALVIGLIVAKASQSPAAAAGSAADPAVTRLVTTVPAATFDRVGAGTATGLKATAGQPLLSSGGKPELLYMGGQYCPFCAAERWAIAAEQALFSRYAGGSIPFVDIGNQYILPQAQYAPTALAGLTWARVAAAMHNPASTVARDIDGAANQITAAICKLTHGQPGGACSAAGVRAASASI